jgi:hypothetical protein
MARFLLGYVAFATKAAATAEVRRILRLTPLEVPLTDRDAGLITALYARHPRGRGVPVSFHVGTNSYYGSLSRGFQAVFADGSRHSFSYLPCLSPQIGQPNVLAVMRGAVMPSQRLALQQAYQGRAQIRCALGCGAMLDLAAARVHHKWPKFRDIADAFLSLVGAPELISAEDSLSDRFADPRLEDRWVRFHDAVAQRVVVCAACNAADERRNPEE